MIHTSPLASRFIHPFPRGVEIDPGFFPNPQKGRAAGHGSIKHFAGMAAKIKSKAKSNGRNKKIESKKWPQKSTKSTKEDRRKIHDRNNTDQDGFDGINMINMMKVLIKIILFIMSKFLFYYLLIYYLFVPFVLFCCRSILSTLLFVLIYSFLCFLFFFAAILFCISLLSTLLFAAALCRLSS